MKAPIPREHGAWAMLAIPLVLGLAEARTPRSSALLMLPAMLFVYLARSAAVPALSRSREGRRLPSSYLRWRLAWTGLYLGAALACFAASFALADAKARPAMGYAALAPLSLGIVHAALGVAGRERSLVGELIGMAGLASAAPLVVAASGTELGGAALGASGLALIYFLSSLSFVRTFRRIKTRGSQAPAPCVLVHLALLLGLGALFALGWVPAAACLAFVPIGVRTAWGLYRPPRDLRVLGWCEVAVAAAFLLVAVAAIERGA